MNNYFQSAKRQGKSVLTLNAIRIAIIQNKTMLLGTTKIDHWMHLLKDEFPDVRLKAVDGGIEINGKEK